jgi:hypothetical protein
MDKVQVVQIFEEYFSYSEKVFLFRAYSEETNRKPIDHEKPTKAFWRWFEKKVLK